MSHSPESILIELIRYNNWANEKVIEACLKLDAGQLATSAPGTYGSIQRTLGHLIAAEADYIGRITGSEPRPPFRWQDGPGVEEMGAFAREVGEALLETVQRTPPGQMVHEEENGNSMDYTAQALFIQVIDHGIEHRTNITTILNGLGLGELEIDGWGFLFAHPERFALKETFSEQPHADH